MTPTRHLGVDLGGTNIKAVVIERSDDGQDRSIIYESQSPTNAEGGPDAVTDDLIVAGHKAQETIAGITTMGLGVPGLFTSTGVIELFPNLPGPWEGFALRETVSSGVRLDAAMINDARAFTVAEGTIGSGRGAKVMLGITLGTGIGGGVMIDGRLHLGAFGTAGEFGHQTVDPQGPMCGCGNRGCLEAVARGAVVARGAGFGDIEELHIAAKRGDTEATAAIDLASQYMAIAISNAISLLGVDVVVVGGGIASAGDLVLEPLRRAVDDRVRLVPTDKIRIIAGTLGPMAGAVGAALAGVAQAPILDL